LGSIGTPCELPTAFGGRAFSASRDISSFSRSGPEIAAEKQGHLQRTISEPDFMEPYRQTVDDILAALETDARSGLSQRQARERLERYGRNELASEKPVPAWRKFLAQFTDTLVVLLLVAALISAVLWLYERDSAWPYEATAIFAIVLLNALMGYIQQSRAEQAVAALRQMSAAQAEVVRDGARQSIPATELVTSSSSKRATPFPPTRG
jgi:magnesium-transporting ATPase (P-type)